MRVLATVFTAALLAGGASAQTAPRASTPPPSAPSAAQPGPTSPAPIDVGTAAAPASGPEFATDGLDDTASQPRDRYEKLNRGIWGFNQTVDRFLLKPISSGYRAVVPRVARRGISRVFDNLSEPWSFVNNLLQGKPKRAINNLGRFLVNTTIGVGGLADHATKMGIAPRPEDFGQTLAVWGVKSSAYLVLPVLGPSTVRDGVGTGVAFVADPYQIALNQTDLSTWTKRGIVALSVISTRADLTESGADAFLQSSLDPYASARSAFLQRRAAAIANQEDDAAPETGTGDSSAPASTAETPADTRAVPSSDPVPAGPTPTSGAASSAAPAGRVTIAWNQPHLGYVLD